MLDQRRRRRADVVQMLYKCIVLAGLLLRFQPWRDVFSRVVVCYWGIKHNYMHTIADKFYTQFEHGIALVPAFAIANGRLKWDRGNHLREEKARASVGTSCFLGTRSFMSTSHLKIMASCWVDML